MNLPSAAFTLGKELASTGLWQHLAWLIVPGLMKKAHYNMKNAELELQSELGIKRTQEQTDLANLFKNIDPRNASFSERAVSSFINEVQEGQKNREAIALFAFHELAANKLPPPTEQLDEDFIRRFYRYSEEISTEDVQKLWGKLLAGEIKNKGSFSLKFLDILRNISHHDSNFLLPIANCSLWCGIPLSWVYYDHLEININELSKHKLFCRTSDFYKTTISNSDQDIGGGQIAFPTGKLKLFSENRIDLKLNIIQVYSEFHEFINLVSDFITPNKAFLSAFISELRNYGFIVTVNIAGYEDDHAQWNQASGIHFFEPIR